MERGVRLCKISPGTYYHLRLIGQNHVTWTSGATRKVGKEGVCVFSSDTLFPLKKMKFLLVTEKRWAPCSSVLPQ